MASGLGSTGLTSQTSGPGLAPNLGNAALSTSKPVVASVPPVRPRPPDAWPVTITGSSSISDISREYPCTRRGGFRSLHAHKTLAVRRRRVGRELGIAS